jgi:cardiolipin synthase
VPDSPFRRVRSLLVRPGVLWRLRRLGALEDWTGARIAWGNRVAVFHRGDAAFDELEGAIASARRGIAIEMYTWADDRLGRRIAEAVAARCREGVPAFVVLDAFGSLGSGAIERAIVGAGGRVLWYHPLLSFGRTWFPNRRNHRKLVLVDGEVAFAGGMNFAEVYSSGFAGDAAWRDLSVRVEGPAVRDALRLFLGTWGRAGGDLVGPGALAVASHERGRAGVQFVGGRGLLGRRKLRRSHLVTLAQARRRILIANAYFVPEAPLRRQLVRAARAGVRVDLLLPGATDVPLVRWASRATYDALLEAGVRIREHRGPVLHAKAAVIDDEVLVTGSANLDYRSYRHNQELSVSVFDGEAARDAREGLERDFDRASPIELETWRRRGTGEQLRERLATLLRYWL